MWHGRTELTEVPGTGMKVFPGTELPEVAGIVARAYRTYTSSGQVQRCCTRTLGIVALAYRTYRSFGYGYECRTELTEVLGTGLDVVQNSQKFRVRVIPG